MFFPWLMGFRRPTFGRAMMINRSAEEKEVDLKDIASKDSSSESSNSEDELIQLHPADKDWATSVDKNIRTVYEKMKKNGDKFVSSSEPSDSVGEDGDIWFKLPGMG